MPKVPIHDHNCAYNHEHHYDLCLPKNDFAKWVCDDGYIVMIHSKLEILS
jgi:hypothetical protein